jgi:hypothetical protein
MRGRKLLLVVGIETLTDAAVELHRGWEGSGGAGAELPILAVTGVPIPTPLDPGAEANCSVRRDVQLKYDIQGEKVFSIQYREIKLRKHHFGPSVEARLTSKTWWEQICSDRSAADMEDEEETIT